MTGIENAILGMVEENKGELIDLLKKLISFPSENEGIPGTGKETELQRFIHQRLREYRFDRVEDIAPEDSPERPNVVGTLEGTNSERALMLNAHADVVPVKEEERKKWSTNPYEPVESDGKVFGRGATDTKGGLAAILFAANVLKELDVELLHDLYVVSSVGEESQEGETIGTALVADRGYKASFAVIAEPSNCEIHVESPGVFFFELKVKGKEAHSCVRNQVLFPQRYGLPSGSAVGVDAIEKLISFIQLFQKIEVENNHKWKSPTLSGGGYPTAMDRQGLGFFTLTPSLVKGGEYLGAVAGYASITYIVWYPNWMREIDVAADIKRRVMSLSETDDWLRENPPEFIYPTLQHWKPFRTPLDHAGVQRFGKALSDVQHKDPIYSAFRAVCDGTFLQDRGVPSIVFGPGGMEMGAHGPNEYVPVDELIACAKTYALFAYRWCTNKP
jgi:acetylornithine deacetylase